MIAVHRRDNDVTRHWLWFGYVTKATHPDAALRWHRQSGDVVHNVGDLVLQSPMPGGRVLCRKRVGVSRNLDRLARLQFSNGVATGFRSKLLDGNFFDKHDLYSDSYLHDYQSDKAFAALRRI